MTLRRLAVVALGTVVIGTLSVGCGPWGVEGGPGTAPASTPTASADPLDIGEAVAGPDGVQRVDIVVTDDLRMTPSVVRARPGVIELRFRNAGITPHAFEARLPEAAPATGNLNGGEDRTIRVTVTEPGRYPLPCLYHAASGMQGTLDIR